jgi:hypothetical protein
LTNAIAADLTNSSRALLDTDRGMNLPISEFNAAVRPRLEAIGLKKRAGDVYTIEVGEGFLGVVALGRAREHGSLQIWPTVGVRHEPTEELLGALTGQKAHAYVPATIGCGLGYVMPEQRWIEWPVEDATGAETVAIDVSRAVAAFGLPAITANASLNSVLDALSSPQTMSSSRVDYLLPVVLAQLHRVADAAAEVDRQIEARASRNDPEADHYRAFADAFEQWLTTT